MWKYVLLGAGAIAVIAVATALVASWIQARDAEAAFDQIEGAATPPTAVFDEALLADLPEVARRYFLHAIAPGTLLRTTVRLRMEGQFLLGDKTKSQTYAMTASQILAPPDRFVWIPRMTSGPIEITGSDGLTDDAWTRFWLNRILPVVNLKGGADLTRSALSRPALEAIWAPASLLPQNGAVWEQIGQDTARVTFNTGIEPVDLTLGPDGTVLKVVTMRWSDANAEKAFHLQPFGGTMEEEATFEGFTIPSRIAVGNHFGTGDYLAFFQARIIDADFLPN